ncbi:hypothetical protein MY5147_008328 [Beauveria neobassiana]
MKIYKTLALVLLSAASAHPTETTNVNLHATRQEDAGAYAKSLLSGIETGFTLNNESPPELPFTKDWQYICAANIGTANQVAFWHTATILQEDIKKVKAYYVPHVEATATNTGRTKDVEMVIIKSTTTLQVENKGWTVGAKLSGSGGKKDVLGGGVELSASYSHTKTNSYTETKTISHKASCEPGYACRIETWTIHLGVYAKPAHWPYYQLWSFLHGYKDARYLCAMKADLRDCSQFTDRLDQWCDPKKHGVLKSGSNWVVRHPQYYDVELKLPVYEENGFQPMSRVVLVSEPIAKRPRDEVSEVAEAGTLQAITEALEKGTKFQFLD